MSGRSTSLILIAALAIAGFGSAKASAPSCTVDHGELPTWARTGFSDPHPKIGHVVGDAGRITAILFAEPLKATAPDDAPQNKVLWVAKDPQQPLAALKIRVTQGDETLTRTVENGPGPSIVDLPRGCWKLELSWSGRTDQLNLEYR